MDNLYNWGITLILFLQNLGDWLIPMMKFFTNFGDEEFFLLVIPFLYWCIDTKVAIRTGLMLMLSESVKNYSKWLFHEPRPYWITNNIKAYVFEPSFGLPSGHAQNSVAIWGIIGNSYNKPWLWVLSIILMFLIGASRLVLGVHFPQDTVLGWIIGLILLILFITLEPKVITWVKPKTAAFKVSLFLSLAIVLMAIGYIILSFLKGWTFPELWLLNIAKAFPNQNIINPLTLSSQVTVGGVTFGLGLGHTLLFSGSGFNPKGLWWKKFFRYITGLIGVIIIWYGLDLIFPDGESFVPYIFRFIRYFMIGFWVTFLGPLLFIHLKIANPLNQSRIS